MDHLSSCYFCGAALDEPIGAYSLAPAGGGRSVTLCTSCRHKLDTLLEANHFDPTVPADETEQTDDSSDESEPATPGEPDHSDTGADSTAADETAPAPSMLDESTDGEPAPEPDETKLETDHTENEESTGTEPTIAPGSVAAAGPEPVTTDPSELPDDEDVAVVPGLDADESAESTLGEEMEPTVPDEFADEPDAEEPADSPAEITSDDGLDSLTTDTDEDEPDESDDTNDILGETDGVDTTPIDSEQGADTLADDEPVPNTNADEPENTSADGVDPSILQADEIATGQADIGEVLGEETDVPADTDPEPADVRGADDALTEDEPFDIDATDGPDDAPEPDDGGFNFDNGPDTSDGDTLQSEMEPDIPDEFSSTAEEIAGAASNDTDSAEIPDREVAFEEENGDEDDASSLEGDDTPEEATDAEERESPSPEEIAFGESGLDESSDSSTSKDDTVERTGSGDESRVAGNSVDADPVDRRSISALEYNKVMRLLQNREFPIDRMELLAVAASTYDLSQAECETVLDIAVERGLLAEEGDKLVKPD